MDCSSPSRWVLTETEAELSLASRAVTLVDAAGAGLKESSMEASSLSLFLKRLYREGISLSETEREKSSTLTSDMANPQLVRIPPSRFPFK